MSTSTAQPQFEKRVADLGRLLARRVAEVVAAVPGSPQGPVNLAKAVGVDKVLASRVIRASTHRDPIAAMQIMPSPDLLRRLATAAGRKGVSTKLVRELEASVQDYDEMIRSEAGDRSGFEAILSSWLPESRGEFEMRRKQAAYRAMSQLVGRSTDVHLATAIIHPSADGQHIDIVWITALLGLQRLRPGVAVKFASRRVGVPDGERAPRRPRTLDGIEVEGVDGLRLDAFCSAPPPPLLAQRVGEVVHYTLGDTGFGPKSKSDLVYAEVNLNELPRYFPPEPKRQRYVFAEVSTPANLLVLDALIHRGLLDSSTGQSRPELFIYDTVLEGVASVNDRSRDASRLDLRETLEPLGAGLRTYRVSEMPAYLELLELSFAKLGWNSADVLGFRTRIDYPVYGSQVAIAFDTQSQR
jgi:hypothetical protein